MYFPQSRGSTHKSTLFGSWVGPSNCPSTLPAGPVPFTGRTGDRPWLGPLPDYVSPARDIRCQLSSSAALAHAKVVAFVVQLPFFDVGCPPYRSRWSYSPNTYSIPSFNLWAVKLTTTSTIPNSFHKSTTSQFRHLNFKIHPRFSCLRLHPLRARFLPVLCAWFDPSASILVDQQVLTIEDLDHPASNPRIVEPASESSRPALEPAAQTHKHSIPLLPRWLPHPMRQPLHDSPRPCSVPPPHIHFRPWRRERDPPEPGEHL